jgi:hypothetical protein
MYFIAFSSDFCGSWAGRAKFEGRSGMRNFGVIEISYLSWFKLEIIKK